MTVYWETEYALPANIVTSWWIPLQKCGYRLLFSPWKPGSKEVYSAPDVADISSLNIDWTSPAVLFAELKHPHATHDGFVAGTHADNQTPATAEVGMCGQAVHSALISAGAMLRNPQRRGPGMLRVFQGNDETNIHTLVENFQHRYKGKVTRLRESTDRTPSCGAIRITEVGTVSQS